MLYGIVSKDHRVNDGSLRYATVSSRATCNSSVAILRIQTLVKRGLQELKEELPAIHIADIKS